MSDEDIDFSDIPEMTDEQIEALSRAPRGRDPWRDAMPVAPPLDPEIAAWLERKGDVRKQANAILREAMEREERESEAAE